MNSLKVNATNSILSYPDLDKDTHSESLIQYTPKKVFSLKKKIIIGVSIFCALIIISLLTLIIINVTSNYIFNNISIDGLDVSHLTIEEAFAKVSDEKNALLNNSISLVYDDIKTEINGNDINGHYSIENAVNKAYSIGRSGNIFTNNFNMIFSNFEDVNILCDFSFDEMKLTELLESVSSKLPQMKEASYIIEEDKVIITKGKSGLAININEIVPSIISALQNGYSDDIIIPVTTVYPSDIDIDKIHQEVYKAPVDATYKTDPFEIIPHQIGVDFDMSLEEINQLLLEDNDEYVIPLAYAYPEITIDQIGSENFPNLLASFETTYIQSKANRTNNLMVASDSINGVVIMPGEIFSYNKTLGPRTVEAGYKMAGIYSGGKEVDGLGGGICQISSNLYNIALMANLEIVERYNHQFLPGYVGAGMDATVVYGSLDFKFKNTRNYPIKIESSVGNGYAKVKLYGVKEDNEYDVSFSTTILSTIYPQVIYEDSYSLAPGETRVQSYGQNGCKSETYKILSQNGVEVSRELLSRDTYSAKNKYILRGVSSDDSYEE